MMTGVIRDTASAAPLDASFQALYAREAPVVLRYLRAAVPDLSTAEDLCADAFYRAWQSWPRFSGSEAESRAWVIRIARNLLRRVGGRVRHRHRGRPDPGCGGCEGHPHRAGVP